MEELSMFLNYLNRNCREAVMDLAIYMSLANDVICKSEETMMNQYYQELGIPFRGYEPKDSFENVIKALTEGTTTEEKRMILFEIIAIAFADGSCDEKEEKMLRRICTKWQISEALLSQIKIDIEDLRKVYKAIAVTIGKGK